VHACHPRSVLLAYWACSVGREISCGVRKLARTPRVTGKKKSCNVPLLLTDAREIKESMPQVNAQKLLLLLLFGFCSVKKGKERSLREQK
jgi:hypothetical protein